MPPVSPACSRMEELVLDDFLALRAARLAPAVEPSALGLL